MLQDPSYDPYGFAKVATRTASSQAGAAPACSANVQKFFQTLFQLGQSPSGLDQVNQDMSLCSNSMVASYTDLNSSLAAWVQFRWTDAVSSSSFIMINVITTMHHHAHALCSPISPNQDLHASTGDLVILKRCSKPEPSSQALLCRLNIHISG